MLVNRPRETSKRPRSGPLCEPLILENPVVIDNSITTLIKNEGPKRSHLASDVQHSRIPESSRSIFNPDIKRPFMDMLCRTHGPVLIHTPADRSSYTHPDPYVCVCVLCLLVYVRPGVSGALYSCLASVFYVSVGCQVFL